MARPRSKANQWLPQKVYRGKSRYEYRPESGYTVKLCKIPKDGETELIKAEVWRLYLEVKDVPVVRNDMSSLMDDFENSPQWEELSPATQGDYRGYRKQIEPVFGKMLPQDVEPVHIRQYMDVMYKKGVKVQPNRHHSYLSRLFSWALERAYVDSNPAKSVRKFRETSRDRYIEDWEFELVLRVARSSGYPYMAPLMELAYLCRARSGELLRLTEHDVREDGMFLKRSKKSMSEITGWTDRLDAVINEARNLFPDAPTHISRPLIHGRNGRAIPAETRKTAMTRIMAEALRSGLKERFTFHDIKAKGISDHKNKQGGHRSKKMQAVYDRKPDVTLATR